MNHEIYIEAEDNFDLAVEWIKNGDRDKAVLCLKRCISLNPNFIYAYMLLARVLCWRGELQEALQFLVAAGRLDPAFDYLDFLMAKVAYKKGDFNKAARYIDSAIGKKDRRQYRWAKAIIEKNTRTR